MSRLCWILRKNRSRRRFSSSALETAKTMDPQAVVASREGGGFNILNSIQNYALISLRIDIKRHSQKAGWRRSGSPFLRIFHTSSGGNIPCKRPRARRHLEQDNAEREDVGSSVGWFAFGLLGRHVGGRSEHTVRRGEQGGRRFRLGRGVQLGPQLRETEVQDLEAAVVSYHDVGWLEITVDDPALVCGTHGVSERKCHRQEPSSGSPPGGMSSTSVLPSTSSIVRKCVASAFSTE